MEKNWILPVRNWEGIQFEKLRKKIDPKFNEAHDALSKAFYEKRAFIWKGKNWGVLNRETFNKLHGLIFELRHLAFHAENKRQPARKQIPEEEYNETVDEFGNKQKLTDRAQKKIDELKNEKLKLEI